MTWVRPWYADDAVVLNSQSVASEAASVPCNYADVTIVGASPRGHATRWERLRVQCDCSRFITEVLLARRSPSTTDPSARHLGHSARRGDVTHMQHSATLRSTSASTKGKASDTCHGRPSEGKSLVAHPTGTSSWHAFATERRRGTNTVLRRRSSLCR